MLNFKISVTEDYEKLVPFFIENKLEFSDEDPVPTDLVKCWKIVRAPMDENYDESKPDELIGGFVLAKRQEEYIVDGIAIAEEFRSMNLGKELLYRGIEEVLKLGGRRIFLVARAPGFFRKHGFVTVSREEAPEFFECLTCPQYGIECHPEVMVLQM